MDSLTQTSQANVPNLSQDQIYDIVSRNKISDRRKRNEMFRSGIQDPNAFTLQNTEQISQASQPQEYWPAGGHPLNSDISDPILGSLFNIKTRPEDGQQYYWGDVNPNDVTVGPGNHRTEDLGLGKYNIYGDDNALLGTGYKSVRDALADYTIDKTFGKIQENKPTGFLASFFPSTYSIGPLLQPSEISYDDLGKRILQPGEYSYRFEAENAIRNSVLSELTNANYGGPLGDWEALGQVLNGTPPGIFNLQGGHGFLPPNQDHLGGYPANRKIENISGLNTLFGSTPIFQGDKLLGYYSDFSPGETWGYQGKKHWDFSTPMGASLGDNKGKERYVNSVWRELNPGDWSGVKRLQDDNIFVTPENAASVPGWTNKDQYNYVDASGTLPSWFGPVGTVMSFIPGMQPIGAFMSAMSSMDSGNTFGALANLFGMTGGFDTIAGQLGDFANLSPEVAKAVVKGGTNFAGNLASGKDFKDSLLGGVIGGLGNYANSTATAFGNDYDLGDLSKVFGGAADLGLNSLFAKNQAIKGSLYGDKSGGLWGYLNSNKSPQEEPITHRIRNENGSETRNNRTSTSS
jgi:hypothetical protein